MDVFISDDEQITSSRCLQLEKAIKSELDNKKLIFKKDYTWNYRSYFVIGCSIRDYEELKKVITKISGTVWENANLQYGEKEGFRLKRIHEVSSHQPYGDNRPGTSASFPTPSSSKIRDNIFDKPSGDNGTFTTKSSPARSTSSVSRKRTHQKSSDETSHINQFLYDKLVKIEQQNSEIVRQNSEIVRQNSEIVRQSSEVIALINELQDEVRRKGFKQRI